MANKANQKLKLLYIMEMFLREPDEHHTINAADLIRYLDRQGIDAERKSIYRDIDALIDYGMDIVKTREGKPGFYLASRDFELPELKLLADAVAASKFITEKKSAELLKKIEQLASRYEAKQLQRQVVVADRTKTENSATYYAVDVIYTCIDHNHQMEFQYSEWTPDKKKALRKDGAKYRVSPEFLLWDNENYYLVAYDEEAKAIRHYRVDKIVGATETEAIRGGTEQRAGLKKSDYARKRFGMFAGETRTVVLQCPKEMAGVMIDRLGADIAIRPEKEKDIVVRTELEVSPQFDGWLTGLGHLVRIKAPADVAEDYRKYLQNILDSYDEKAET